MAPEAGSNAAEQPGATVGQLVDHLFRREAAKMVATLTRSFGFENLNLAQDVVQDAILKALCAFNEKEIAAAFLTSTDAIAKRLVRARQKIRETEIALEMPEDGALISRLETVLRTLYLLFNEGYKTSRGDELVRKELC